jgi:hypothetical protein
MADANNPIYRKDAGEKRRNNRVVASTAINDP